MSQGSTHCCTRPEANFLPGLKPFLLHPLTQVTFLFLKDPAPTCLVRITGFKCGVKDLFL